MTKNIIFIVFLSVFIITIENIFAGPDTAREGELLPGPSLNELPLGAKQQFSTDFSRTIVPYSEIISGGPGKDGIPSIDSPAFISVETAGEWLSDSEPVLVAESGGEAHIYPISILMLHEIVNDEINGTPIAVTYCPLCNTSIGFKRVFKGKTLEFGTTGNLRHSNLIMYDRDTESWWQQATGEGVVGAYAGEQLSFHPVLLLPWKTARESFPAADVLSQETGYPRAYGRNPYEGYDHPHSDPFLYRGPEPPEVLPPLARVVAVRLGNKTRIYAYTSFEKQPVIHDTIRNRSIVLFWQPGMNSPLDSSYIASGREVGTVNGFIPEVEGEQTEFTFEGTSIVDTRTGSKWDASGRAIQGELEGMKLAPVVTIQHFWFSASIFYPEAGLLRDGLEN